MSKVMDEYLSRDREWGVVTMYNKDRGFGFIKSKVDGKSYFTHVSQIHGGYLERGYLVEFNIGINKRTGKEQAENVIVIETPLYRKRYCKTSKISYKSKFKKF